jgi:transcriptional regulator with XRE-family HTH domain
MAAAVDSAATMASQAERVVAQEGCVKKDEGAGATGHVPVFGAFDDLGLTGRDVAELVGVTPPTVSKWRSAKVRIPNEKLAFLTLVLAHLLDEADMGRTMNVEGSIDAMRGRGPIEAARAGLAYQDVLNRDLPVADVRAAAQRFRAWWESGHARKLQDKRFTPPASADILRALQNMRKKR